MCIMLIKKIVDIINRHRSCILCDLAPATILWMCDYCYSVLPWIKTTRFRCKKCLTIVTPKQANLCESCKTTPKFFDNIKSIFEYSPPIKNMLSALKFNHKLIYSEFLGNILLATIKSDLSIKFNTVDAVIPVPLHIDKLRSRGFNQAVELAKSLQPLFKIDESVCDKIKSTISQTHLSKPKRQRNIAKAFKVKKISYKNIILLDDVVTTASTVNSLAAAIKVVNPEVQINVWSIARS